jgi:predicted permease
MKEEFRHHLDLEAQQQRAADADFAARRRFGNQTRLEEETRRMTSIGFLEVLGQDLRFAMRSFLRTPGFTAITILVLAIGIGANTAIFSAVNTLLLRPLPFPEPDRLMKLSLTIPASGENPAMDDVVWSVPKFQALRTSQTVFQDQGLYTEVELTVRGEDQPVREFAEITDGHYFSTLNLGPALGRDFDASEVTINGPKAVLLANGYWQRRFNADPAILGRTITIQREPYTVIGVMPAGFRGMSGRAEFWISIAALWGEGMNEPQSHAFTGIGRRQSGVTGAQAVAQVHDREPRIDASVPRDGDSGPVWGAVARPLDATRVDPIIRRSLLVLTAAVALVLLIVVANVANLFLIRATGRKQEIAVRLAIGAGRGRVIRQLLTESVLLAVIGGIAGMLLAWGGVALLAQLDPASALRGRELGGIGAVGFNGITLDSTALAFALGVTLVTGICFGLVPAWQSTRPGLSEGLRGGSAHRGWRGISSRNLLVVGEIALALILLVGSGLVIRSLGRMIAIDTGVQPKNVLTLRLNLEGSRDSMTQGYNQIIQRLGALPGVQSVAISDCLPLSGGCNGTSLWRRDRPEGEGLRTGVHWITPDWSRTLGVPLLQGRTFSSEDRMGARKSVLVNEAAAKSYWPGEDPIGRPVGVGQGGFADTAYVVGVVGNVKYESIDAAPAPSVYLPFYQSPRPWLVVNIRTQVDPVSLAGPARRILQEIAPASPVYDVRTLESRVSDAMAYARFSALLLGAFAGVALVLATMGTYGVISFSVAQRTRELGIRAALGASRMDVVRLVAGHGAMMAGLGGVIGLGGALLVTRLLGAMLYDVPSNDPLTFGVVAVVMLLAVAAASLVPARRAASVPPAIALK